MTSTTAVPPAPPIPARTRLRGGRRVQRTSGRLFKYAALAFFAVLVLMPVYVLVVTSFKDVAETDPSHAWSWPHVWTTAAWHQAWDQLSPNLANSFRLVIPATIISTILGSLNGFVLSKWRFPGADFVFPLILFGMFIPYQAIIIPMYQVMSNAGLRGGLDGLILVHIIYGLPITTLIFRSYFAGISDEIIEAAQVDGAGMLRTFFYVALPIAPPAFAVAMIWQFTSAWNDFLFGAVMTNRDYWPITITLNNIAGGQAVPFNEAMASALLACIPTVAVYIVLGRFFMRGLMAGALKG